MLQTLGRPRQRPAPGTYRLDRTRCLAQFSVRHFMVSTVRGTLQPIDGSLVLAGDGLADSSVRVDLDASSLDTGHGRRDPVVRFESRQLVGTDPARFDIVGDLYLGVRATPICLSARVVAVRDKAVSFVATGAVRRTDVDLAWRRALEGFGLVVGDTVRLTIGAEFVA